MGRSGKRCLLFLARRETVLAIYAGEPDYDDACKAVIAGSLMPV
jgi:hypothetical protein